MYILAVIHKGRDLSISSSWAVYNMENEEYTGFYLVRFFIWQTPTEDFFISSDIRDIRWWVGENNKYRGNKNLICLNPAPHYFPNLMEIWF